MMDFVMVATCAVGMWFVLGQPAVFHRGGAF